MNKYRYLVKRKGRYYYRFYHNGRQVERGGYVSFEEAYLARKKHLEQLALDKVPDANLTLDDFVRRFLKNHEAVNNRYSTFLKVEGLCRNYIMPALGDRRLREITTMDVVQFQVRLVQEKTPATAHNTMRVLRRIFKKAVEWQLIPASPLWGPIPSAPRKEHPVIGLSKLREIIAALEGRDRAVIALLGLSGLRRSEVFGLQWGDVDFEGCRLSIRRQFSLGKIEPLKTDESRSVLPICQDLAAELKLWKLRCGSSQWVFKGLRENLPLSGNWWACH